MAAEFGVAAPLTDPLALIDSPDVDAVVIVSPTSTHASLAIAAAGRGKPTFCEKPPALDLGETLAMKAAVERAGSFFQLGFMRRFDAGYAAAKARIADGAIGDPVVFKSTSRDPFRPSVEYANPKSSGGMILDMGIHDFDLARWFMGEVASVHAIGGVLAYPELGEVGDIDNAIVSLTFESGRLGVVDLTRNGIYGYDITTELLGTKGTLRIGYLRETPLMVMTKNSVAARHRAVFHGALPRRLHGAARELRGERPPRSPAADHDRRWRRGTQGRVGGDACARERRLCYRVIDQGLGLTLLSQ